MSGRERQGIRVAIVGAGPGGLCMGIRLREAGIEDFTILEKNPGVGGTWYQNRYPGCECDIPAPLYSYSFELNSS
jgi:cation diffusion facilitator CzcD-associated flavoprotein CzcO